MPEIQGQDRRGVQARGRTVGQVAKDFDLTKTVVRDWGEAADLDAGTSGPTASPAMSASTS